MRRTADERPNKQEPKHAVSKSERIYYKLAIECFEKKERFTDSVQQNRTYKDWNTSSKYF